MFARAPSGALGAIHARRRHAARVAILQYGASGVPRSPSPCEAVLQFMRQSLAGLGVSYPRQTRKITHSHCHNCMVSWCMWYVALDIHAETTVISVRSA